MKINIISKQRKKETLKNLKEFRRAFKINFRKNKIYKMIEKMPLNLNKYLTKYSTGGMIKKYPEDFIVEEITEDGIVLEVGKEIGFEDEKNWNGSFIHFTLEKKNWNTLDAIREIAKQTKSKRKNFGFAGTKDKFAITTQRIGCFGVNVEDLKKVNLPNITLKDFQKTNKKLKIGCLWGNRFTIKVRDMDVDKSELEDILKELSKLKYVLNYFGIQRFGSVRPITHVVGKFIVQGDFESAFYAYCGTPLPYDGRSKEARTLVDEGEFKEALKIYPKIFYYEKKMIRYYLKHRDYKKSFNVLPPQLKSMFVNAYQSYLFNEMINERYRYGYEPLEGDILKDGLPTGALIGYNPKFADGIQGEIERNILEREGIKLENFKIKGFGNFFGDRRPLITRIYDLEYRIDDDGYVLRFKLKKGTYATSVLREFIDKKINI
ncbi:tRNA pseudouridine(13) synthase TruD [Methanotorris formicicus]|uniref:Probable tRNA pseudouridine synthase D n=1 Tax=Methanotorris formicicus Mc-S-70 TaxID=647171 RepID=H1L0U8_9EURY|nr:tRNA pseudouridine(13) synthase TruD [Methanotorris formicicus]EHP84395.1 tRNA pseudouridine synthase D TruD [Methanotorris formicicus Mc-S-70]